jgi:hypothetical protein
MTGERMRAFDDPVDLIVYMLEKARSIALLKTLEDLSDVVFSDHWFLLYIRQRPVRWTCSEGSRATLMRTRVRARGKVAVIIGFSLLWSKDCSWRNIKNTDCWPFNVLTFTRVQYPHCIAVHPRSRRRWRTAIWSDSLPFGAWHRLDFIPVALGGPFFARNILVVL